MNIILTGNSVFYPPRWDDSKVNQSILTGLAQRGHCCCAVVPGYEIEPKDDSSSRSVEAEVAPHFPLTNSSPEAYEFRIHGVRVRAARIPASLTVSLRQMCSELDPDFIIATSEDPELRLVQASLETGKPVFFLAHSVETLLGGRSEFVQSSEQFNLLEQCVGTIAISQHVQNYLREQFGIDSVLLQMPIYGGEDLVTIENYFDACRNRAHSQSFLRTSGLPQDDAVKTRRMLTAKVRDHRRRSGQGAPTHILHETSDGPVPLSFAQERLWFLHELEIGSTFYNESLALCLHGQVDAVVLQRALNAIAQRHSILRTIFPQSHSGRPVAIIDSGATIDLSCVRKEGLNEGEAIAALTRSSHVPFDVARGPLWRACLLTTALHLHYFLIETHHIVADNWSITVFLKELVAFYEAGLTGTAAIVPNLRIQYSDFARWQREKVNGAALRSGLEFWRMRLSAIPELRLPYPGIRTESLGGDTFSFQVENLLTRELKRRAAELKMTPFQILLTAFQLVLQRYSDQTSFLTGTPVTNRANRETEDLIGCFANILVITADFAGDPTLSEALARTRRLTLEAYAHADVPFEKVVEALQPERALGKHPLFQVMFALQNLPAPPTRFGGLNVDVLTIPSKDTKFDLYLDIGERSEDLSCRIQYRTDLFDKNTVSGLAKHFKAALKAILYKPEVHVSELALVDGAELVRITSSLNWPPKIKADEELVHRSFEKQTERSPSSIAVICSGGKTLSYAELNAQANQVAQMLRNSGAGPEDRVGVCLDRGTDLIAALLGVMKAGAAYLPLDLAYPAERLRYIVADSGTRIVLVTSKGRELLDGSGALLLEIEKSLGFPADAPVTAVCGANAAYVLYTSGSTGHPKGVVIEHRQAALFLSWARGEFQEAFNGCVAFSSSVCFDSSVMEIFGPLTAGGNILIASTVIALAEMPELERVNMISGIPSGVRELSRMVNLAFVPTIIMAGEAITTQLLADIRTRTGSAALFNLYGLTEATTYSTITLMDSDPSRRPSIGKPISNTQIYILDSRFKPVPVGIAGEIYIGGGTLARGYWNRPGLTAERFVPNPFNSQHGTRLYRTGDLAKWREDGEIDYLGRIDSQIKLRGFRIEVSEIEEVLRENSNVVDAAVVVVNTDVQRLVGYIVTRFKTSKTAREIRLWLRQKLPDYMIPSTLQLLETMPLTPNGKVDRNSLSTLQFSDLDCIHESVPPRNLVEQTVAEVWKDVLGLPITDVHGDFFDFGGNSLLAVQVASRLRRIFQLHLPLRLMFTERTVSRLAVEISRVSTQTTPPEFIPDLHRRSQTGDAALSIAQEQLWFLEQGFPGRALYNLPACLRLQGSIDAEAIEWTLNSLVERHESLRTSFPIVKGKPVQRVAPVSGFSLERAALDGAAAGNDRGRFGQMIQEFAIAPFSLDRGPLFKAKLVRMNTEEHALLVNVHHIVCDGWSIGVLVRELCELYSQALNSSNNVLPPLPVAYADFAAWQLERLWSGHFDEQIAFWKRILRGRGGVLTVGTDRVRPSIPSFMGRQIRIEIRNETLTRLKQLAIESGATLFMILTAAVHVLLHHYSGEKTILLRCPTAGRSLGEFEGVVGYFVNEVVLQADLSGNPTYREFLSRVRDNTVAAFCNSEVPFAHIVREVQPNQRIGYQAFSQVALAMQNTPMPALRMPGCSATFKEVYTGSAGIDLHFNVAENTDHLDVTLTYSTDVFESATGDRIAGHFQQLISEISLKPDQPMEGMSLLEARSRDLALSQYTSGRSQTPRYAHDHITVQAMRRPDAVAVVSKGDTMLFRDLHRLSNQLGWHLRELGVAPEVRVAVCLERSSLMVVAILAVLKAGGVYVPLDVSEPKERLKFIVEDSAPAIVITGLDWEPFISRVARKTVCLDRESSLLSSYTDSDLSVVLYPTNAAYVIYTSGSTGRPKGVELTHGGLMNLIKAQAETYHIGPEDRVLQFASTSFDASVYEITLSLAFGASLYIVPPWRSLSTHEFLDFLRANRITVATFPPSVVAGALDEDIPSLSRMILAGEEPSQHVISRWAPGRSLFNAYGPTETTIWATTAICSVDTPSSVIGYPITGSQVYILDTDMQPVAIGIRGELYVGGDGVGRGYLSNPALTSERFVPDLFSGSPGHRLYRTGDCARWRDDGQIEFLGRFDLQVKLRGHRIELGEIESVLRQHSAVRDAIAVVREESAGTKSLTAFVILRDQNAATAEVLHSFCAEKLPEYQVPTSVHILAEFPLTHTGKVDRSALALRPMSMSPVDEVAAPRDAVEKIMIAIWKEVLNKPAIGIHHNFFEIGGDSILAIQIVGRAIEAGIDVSPEDLFRYQTVAKWAEARRTLKQPLFEGSEEEICEAPLTSIQHWFFEQQRENPNHYNQAILLEAVEEIDLVALRAAIEVIVRRYDSLRLRFRGTIRGLRQFTDAAVDGIFSVVDTSQLREEEQEVAFNTIANELQRSLDIRNGPVTRTTWFEQSDGRPGLFLWVTHHLVVDWVSWRLLLDDLGRTYTAFKVGTSPRQVAAPMSFLAWAARLNESAQSAAFDHLLPFWLRRAAFETSTLPTDFVNGTNTVRDQALKEVTLSTAATRLLVEILPSKLNAQITEILLVPLQVALADLFGHFPIRADIESHGRESVLEGSNLSRAIGWFTSVYPIILNDGPKDCGLTEALRLIHLQTSEIKDGGLSYGILRYMRANQETEPLCAHGNSSVGFNYLGQFDGSLSGLRMFRRSSRPHGDVESTRNNLPYRIAIVTYVLDEQLHIRWTYSRRLYRDETIHQLADKYLAVLSTLADPFGTSAARDQSAIEAALSEVEFNQ